MSVSNPGGGISGKGGSLWTAALGASMASTKVEAEIYEWRFLDDVDLIDGTNFNSRDSGDATKAVVDKIAGLDSMNLSIKGKVTTQHASLIAGGFLQVYLGITGGGGMSGVAATDIAAGRLAIGPFAFRVSKTNYSNSVAGAIEFDCTLVSVASRLVTA